MSSIKSRSFKKRLKRALRAKRRDLTPYRTNNPVDESLRYRRVYNSDSTIEDIFWEKDEVLEVYSDDSDLYDVLLKDGRSNIYSFIIERVDSDNVRVTIEGTDHKRSLMTKKYAHWNWDMIWNRIGKPEVLKEEVEGIIKIGLDGNHHSGGRGEDRVKRKKYEKRHDGEIIYYESNKSYFIKEDGKLRYLGTKLKTS